MGDRRPRRVGLIGLGRMGLAVCERLLQCGFDVLATDLDPRRREAAGTAGAAVGSDAATVAGSAEIVVTLLPGPVEVASVAEPIAGAMAPGAIWIEMSTAGPWPALAPGTRVIDAPVGGDPARARSGRLLSFVGTGADELTRVRPVLEALADRIVHVGPPGSGYTVKLLANALWFGQAVAVAEALSVAQRSGLDVETVRGALGQSAAASRFLAQDAAALVRGDDLTSFSLARCCGQLEAVLARGDELGVALELTGVVASIHRAALERYGDVDGELLGARLVAERAGVSFPSA